MLNKAAFLAVIQEYDKMCHLPGSGYSICSNKSGQGDLKRWRAFIKEAM